MEHREPYVTSYDPLIVQLIKTAILTVGGFSLVLLVP